MTKWPTLLSLAIVSVLGGPAYQTVAATSTAVQEHETRQPERRVYDRAHKDYHVWNDAEDHAYRAWLQTKHLTYRAYSKLRRKTRDEYWQWRHDHRDDDRR